MRAIIAYWGGADSSRARNPNLFAASAEGRMKPLNNPSSGVTVFRRCNRMKRKRVTAGTSVSDARQQAINLAAIVLIQAAWCGHELRTRHLALIVAALNFAGYWI